MTADPNRLHADGAPGEAEIKARQMFGDVAFEADRDHRVAMAREARLTAYALTDLATANADVRQLHADLLVLAWWLAVLCIPTLTVAIVVAVIT